MSYSLETDNNSTLQQPMVNPATCIALPNGTSSVGVNFHHRNNSQSDSVVAGPHPGYESTTLQPVTATDAVPTTAGSAHSSDNDDSYADALNAASDDEVLYEEIENGAELARRYYASLDGLDHSRRSYPDICILRGEYVHIATAHPHRTFYGRRGRRNIRRVSSSGSNPAPSREVQSDHESDPLTGSVRPPIWTLLEQYRNEHDGSV